MRVPRYQFGSVVANGKIYIVEGRTLGETEKERSVEIYDPLTNLWLEVSMTILSVALLKTESLVAPGGHLLAVSSPFSSKHYCLLELYLSPSLQLIDVH